MMYRFTDDDEVPEYNTLVGKRTEEEKYLDAYNDLMFGNHSREEWDKRNKQVEQLRRQLHLHEMQQKIAQLSKQKHVQNARIVEFGGVPHIHIDLKNGDIQTIDAYGRTRTTPIKVKNTIQPQSSGINYKNQPRDYRGRWTKILDGIKSIPKRYKKLKRNLRPQYHMKRVQRTRRQYQRQHLFQQWGMPITGKPKKHRRKRR